MKFSRLAAAASVVSLLITMPDIGFGRALYDTEGSWRPSKVHAAHIALGAVHNVGKIGLSVTNQGNFGTGFIGPFVDPVLGVQAPSCEYPYPSQLEYLFSGAFWIGAISGRDTLVSVGADGWQRTREMWPDEEGSPNAQVIRRTIKNENDPDAISEQDIICIYTDTVTNPSYVSQDTKDGRPHRPLGIEVTQRSFAWSYAYAEDFILFDYAIKNIGRKDLNKVYMGIYVDADVQLKNSEEGYNDDICGFRWSVPSPFESQCDFVDTIRVAWISDFDGKDQDSDDCWRPEATNALTSVTGTRVVRTPSDSLKYSFNWWISNGTASLDFGPRKAGTPEDPFRDFGGYLGTPEGDRNKYYIMRHEEFDYDQLFTAKDNTADGWLPPPSQARIFADGFDTRYLLSFGPFDISPGEVLPISFAYIAGEDFLTDCEYQDRIWNPDFPEAYYNYLKFNDLGLNAIWASWIYDNPGVDTDGNGFYGKYRICVYDSIPDTSGAGKIIPGPTVRKGMRDTVIIEDGWIKFAEVTFYEGDGVPDFKGASPPPAPRLRLFPRINEFNEGEITIRWNGAERGTETVEDVFSGLLDFEGYRVWTSLSPVENDFVMVSSYDKDDFNKWIWNRNRGIFVLLDPPFTLDSLKDLYGDGFDPDLYSRNNPFSWQDSLFFFAQQEWNQSDLTDTTLIHKRFPNEPFPCTLDPDSAKFHCPDALVEDSLFKYFEYEYTLKHLLPSQLYYISVTAFDFGSPSSGLAFLETRKRDNYVAEYAQHQNSVAEAKGLNVVAYPNPYIGDGKYRELGFEGRGFDPFGRNLADLRNDQVQRVHFTNLPHKCKIRIFSIDGDLIREIDHDKPKDSPGSMHAEWDMITRNTQAVVSGIYYYSVESSQGNQIGKLVIIM